MARNSLGLFCEKVIEAGWLAAIVIVPLFFNIFSQRVFEPDKLSLLRSIALVMAAAWLLRLVANARGGARAPRTGPRPQGGSAAEGRRAAGSEEGAEGPAPSEALGPGATEPRGPAWLRRVRATPMVLPTLLLIVVYLLTTATSVDWRVSLLGSYQRLQGTYTTLSYLAVFFLMLDGLHTRRQLDRLITTMILVSFPIAMYGLVQHFNLDPLPWGGNVTTRVASNMGNAIFVAAYLIMIVPLTLSRLLENWKAVVGPFDRRDGILGAAAFVLLAGALLAGMSAGLNPRLAWVRFLGLALGLVLQIPIYLLSAPERRQRVLAISLPLTFAFLVGFSWVLEIFFPPAQGVPLSRFFWLGVLAVLLFVAAMAAFAYYLRRPLSRLLLLAAYWVILIAQLVCVFYTQSRGPLLGLLAGLFAYLAVLGLVKRKAWLPWAMGAVAVAVAVFLVMFNTVQSPLIERLRETPYIGRLGKVLQTEEGTGKVRVLIWQGAVEMIGWHPPLEFPGEERAQDQLNVVRPFIGYGPESMYVAYNRFYPPELAYYEKRNASPDRSHNETFDALVMTGIVGFLVYMFVFSSVFYYALRWLGFIRERWQTVAFAGLCIGGAIAGAAGAWIWGGPVYIGVGIPAGVIVGLALYLLVILVQATRVPGAGRSADPPDPHEADASRPERRESSLTLWILALFAALVSHFVEIHFGIAIAATRIYFWAMTAMLVTIGTRLAAAELRGEGARAGSDAEAREKAKAGPTPQQGTRPEPARGQTQKRKEAETDSARGRGQRQRAPGQGGGDELQKRGPAASDWQGALLVLAVVAILMLGTMLFDVVTVQQEEVGLLGTIWQSLTRRDGEPSPAVLVVLLLTWGMIGLVGLSDLATRQESEGMSATEWSKTTAVFFLATLGGALLFALLHAVRLKPVTITSADAPNPLANTITFYYLFAFLCAAGMAAALHWTSSRRSVSRQAGPEPAQRSSSARQAPSRGRTTPARHRDYLTPVVAILLVAAAGILIYATNLTIVRADILYKQGLSSEKERYWDGAIFFYEKAVDLAKGQDFYLLFLGKAYMEKGMDLTGQEREAWLTKAGEALLRAREAAPLNTDHSANLGRLMRAWGEVSTGEAQTERFQAAVQYYADATMLSPNNAGLWNEWGQAYAALGEYASAEEAYRQSQALDSRYVQTYLLLGQLYGTMERWGDAVMAYEQAIEISPKGLQAYLYLGQLYVNQGQLEKALEVYQKAIEASPASADAYSGLGYVYSQLGDLEGALLAYEEAARIKPTNFTNRKNLAIIYQQLGRTEDAIREGQEALALAPGSERAAMQAFLSQLGVEEAPQLAPEDAEQIQLLLNQGRTQMEVEDWPAAESSYEQVLELDPDNLEAHGALGYVYARQGRIDEAIEENLFVVNRLPEDYNTHKNLALLYQQSGDLVRATAAAEKALSLAPEADRPALEAFLEQLRQSVGPETTGEPVTRAGDLTPAERDNMYSTAPTRTIDVARSYQARIVTEKGTILVDLATAHTPQTVNNFVFLARQGFYDGLTFHRVENQPGFAIIQGGDPTGTGRGGPGYTVPAEIALPHEEGAIAMARLGDQVNPERASSGSQFYVCLTSIPQLDGAYTVFGYVVEGLDAAKQIVVGDKILRIEIIEQ